MNEESARIRDSVESDINILSNNHNSNLNINRINNFDNSQTKKEINLYNN